VVRDLPAPTDIAIVFGGDPGFERTSHAARLFRDGLVEALMVCGGEPSPGDSALSLYEHAVRKGVPAEKIVMEDRSTSTRETVLFAKPILNDMGIKSVTLVTSPYHQRRAYLVARRILGDDVRIINSPAQPSFWRPDGWWKRWTSARIVLEEHEKLAYYFVRGWI